jgi:glycosyltransferase involved in cell wall biosynthesis
MRLARRHSMSFLARAKQQVEELRTLMKARPWRRVVLPAGDGLLQAIALAELGGYSVVPPGLPVEALVLRGGVAYPTSRLTQLRRRASWSLLEKAPVTVRHHLDPVFLDWLKLQPPIRSIWRLMPDPVEVPPPLDKHTARMRLGMPVTGVVVGCVGVLDDRKGILLVLDAFEKAMLPNDVRLLLVGTCSPAVRERVSRLRALQMYTERVHLHDRWVTDEDMMTALAAMDVVAVAYPGHVGSASIVLRAMAAERPVLGSSTLWIARHISDYAAGWISKVEDAESFSSALSRAIAAAPSWSPSPRVRDLLAFNSPENFMAHWTRAIVDELGCASPFNLIGPP